METNKNIDNLDLIKLTFSELKEYKLDVLINKILNFKVDIIQLDEHYNDKLNKILPEWNLQHEKLFVTLFQNNDIESIIYLIVKYNKQNDKHVNYNAGYYNQIELFKTGLIKDFNSILLGAIKNDNLEMIKIILSEKRVKNTKLKIYSLLKSALIYNKNEIFKYICDNFSHINLNINSFIFKASFYKNRELFKYLVEKDIKYNNILLEYPIKYCYIDIIMVILNKLPKNSYIDNNLLIIALKYNQIEIFKFLFEFSYLKYLSNNNKNLTSAINYLYRIVEILIHNKNLDLIKFLKEKLENSKNYTKYFIENVSYIAAKINYIEAIKYLNDNNLLNQEILEEISIIASKYGNKAIVEYVLNYEKS